MDTTKFIIGLTLVISAFFWFFSHTVHSQTTSNTPPITINAPQTGDSPLLGEWLNKLAKHENCPDLGIVDSNGLKSYGPYCFQKSTFLMYMKLYKLLPNAEEQELTNSLSDPWLQRELAKRIALSGGAEKNWYTTIVVKKLGLPPIN